MRGKCVKCVECGRSSGGDDAGHSLEHGGQRVWEAFLACVKQVRRSMSLADCAHLHGRLDGAFPRLNVRQCHEASTRAFFGKGALERGSVDQPVPEHRQNLNLGAKTLCLLHVRHSVASVPGQSGQGEWCAILKMPAARSGVDTLAGPAENAIARSEIHRVESLGPGDLG